MGPKLSMAALSEESEGFQLKRLSNHNRRTLIHRNALCWIQMKPFGNGFKSLTPLPSARPRLSCLV